MQMSEMRRVKTISWPGCIKYVFQIVISKHEKSIPSRVIRREIPEKIRLYGNSADAKKKT